MKRRVIIVLSIALAFILISSESVLAGSVSGKLIPVTSELYVSGAGTYSYTTQSDNTIIVSLSIRKLPPNKQCRVWIAYEGIYIGNNYNVGNPIADQNGNLTFTGFVFDKNSGYPNGFPIGTSEIDFKVWILDGSTVLTTNPYLTDTMLEGNWNTLILK